MEHNFIWKNSRVNYLITADFNKKFNVRMKIFDKILQWLQPLRHSIKIPRVTE